MNDLFLNLYAKSQNLTGGEEGQDLVEYALLVLLIALALITSIGYVATALTTFFTRVSTSFPQS